MGATVAWEEIIKVDFDQTIQIQFHSKQPHGLRSVARIAGGCQIYLAPRDERKNLQDQLRKVSKSGKSSYKACVYFLRAEGIPEATDILERKRKLGIGQTRVFKNRLSSHGSASWWEQIVTVSSTNDTLVLTKADIEYLEARFIQKAAKANRVALQNKTRPDSEPLAPTPPGQRTALDDLYEETLDILPMIGIDDFMDPHQANTDHAKSSKSSTGPLQDVGVNKTRERAGVPRKTTQKQNHAPGPYVLKFGGGKARGKMHKDNKRFIVLTDSQVRGGRRENKTWTETDQARFQGLLNDGTIVQDGSHFKFMKSYAFSSMSSAAKFVLGSGVSGPAYWKQADVPQKTTQKQNHASGPYVLKFDGGKAYGEMHKDNKQFIVLAKSQSRGGYRKTKTWKGTDQALLQELLNDGTIVQDGNHFKFMKSYIFSSMSSAGRFVFGSNVSGPLYWKRSRT